VYPLVIDGVEALLSGEARLFRELCANRDATPLSLIMSGPDPATFPDALEVDIREHAGTMITFEADATEGIQRSLLSQDTATLERALERPRLARSATRTRVGGLPHVWL